MKVLHVHTSDNPVRAGGGLIAGYRLHLGLKKAGVESKILCRIKRPEFSDSAEIQCSKTMRKLESLLSRVTLRLGLNDIHCVSSFRVTKNRDYLDTDILTFHCIHGGFFSYLALPSLTANKPAVFTVHDMWPFTGHCTISYDCDRWKIGCGQCPYPDAPNAVQKDNTHLEWKLKNWVYSHSNLAIVTLSSCRTEQVRQSMLNRFPIHQIPNGLDTEVYQPLDSGWCRSLLEIPLGKKVLMFSAVKLGAFNKGGDLLVKSLQSLPKALKAEIVLLLLGDGGEAVAQALDMQTLHLGYANGDRFKAIAYSAADLFVLPTRAESLPLVLQESMACGTPMVSFQVGGVPDIVRPGITGYLAKPEDANDFRDGIVQLLEDEPLRRFMSQQCRAIAVKEYSLELQVQRYIELYRRLLQN
jgi:glycosyltransferase involved in cell wall biosynthesis